MKKFIFLLMTLVPAVLLAQPGMPNNPTPIDGFTGILAAAGVTYGISKYRRRRADKE
ncbi:MAG: PID-CTERM protein-sorting domain-containing protein [Thermaurantimonas sp.]